MDWAAIIGNILEQVPTLAFGVLVMWFVRDQQKSRNEATKENHAEWRSFLVSEQEKFNEQLDKQQENYDKLAAAQRRQHAEGMARVAEAIQENGKALQAVTTLLSQHDLQVRDFMARMERIGE